MEGKDWSREELESKIIGKMHAIAVPVNISFHGRQRVLELGELEAILREATIISQGTCYCRDRVKGCMDPMDGCLGIDKQAIQNMELYGDRRITLEEALAAMRRTHEAGLVHMAYVFEGDDAPTQICSCCSCCCHTLSAAVRFGYTDHAFQSSYVATQDEERCKACGTCVGRCQFHARRLEGGRLEFEPKRCFGCGVCASACPERAIALAKR